MRRWLVYLILIFAFSCKENKMRQTVRPSSKYSIARYGMVTGIKPRKIEYYKQLHARPWPQVLAKIKECNIRNYSIYLQKIEDRYFLFSYFEYTGKDFDSDMKRMAADSMTQRWWKETDPCQLPLAEALKRHRIWTGMEEVFHFE